MSPTLVSPIQATAQLVYDTAQVRIAQLGRELLTLIQDDLPTKRVEESILDLHFGLERAALLPAGPVKNSILGYLIETYGLLAVASDPFLRPWLPAIPSTGARVRQLALSVNGAAVLVNGNYVGVGAELVVEPVTATPTAPTMPAPSTGGQVTGPSTTPTTSAGTMTGSYPIVVNFTNQTEFIVVHYLGRQAQVQVFDTDGQEVDASIEASDLNSVSVAFSPAFTGTLVIR